jgi:hypothetical protein
MGLALDKKIMRFPIEPDASDITKSSNLESSNCRIFEPVN